MPELTVATWNLHQAMDKRATNIARTWDYIANALQPSVALIQEAAHIPPTPGGSVACATGIGYSTAVVGYDARVTAVGDVTTRFSTKYSFAMEPRVPGSFAAAQLVDSPDGIPLVLVSLYGIMAPLYAQTGVLRALADLIPVFDSPALNRRVVVGGDLNVFDQSPDRRTRERWRAILSLIESLGLVNLLKETRSQRERLADCPCGHDECWHVETFRHRRAAAKPGVWHTDYLFATPELAERLATLNVVSGSDVWEMSDHLPLIARFDLDAPRAGVDRR